eukprot:TRINITY_DN609_c0_g1_i1.p1 TRINITY_DN609_c0_g1~~TRINITY_DN609_c0_g1_i1.p1  ORF type:complete len:190 (-),score=60.85 TRINITY_DN609_c0_g1_i1:226-744(-)
MVYHSSFNEEQARNLCNMSILPIKTKYKGPAQAIKNNDQVDIIDEALDFFRANVLFRNYDIKGPADRVLLYLTFYIKQVLKKIENQDRDTASKTVYQLAIQQFSIPGDKQFPFGGFFHNPNGRQEADQCRAYFTQLRQEVGNRVLDRVYVDSDQAPSKWWCCFNRRKFMNLV